MSSLIPIGTLVVAKWPSTSNYYKARILDYTDEKNYICQFLDGSIIALPSKYVDLSEKFQRTTKKLSLMHNELMFFDRCLSIKSMLISLIWIGIYLYIQHWFYFNFNLNQQYPFIVLKYLFIWFILQLIFAKYLPNNNQEELIYIKESYPNIYYKHKSNSLISFILTCLIIIFFREKIFLKELIKSYYLLALFNLGICLTFNFIILTKKLFSRYCAITIINENKIETNFDLHLFISIRPGILLWPILNLILLLTIFKYNHQISIRLALSICFQTIYIINVFLNETSMIKQSLDISPPSSFDALFTNICWIPFMATLTSFYIGKSQQPISNYILFLSISLFIFGFLLQYLAIRQRIEFQTLNNSNPIDSITVNDNQRILTSGCWKWCRNPHLLAEIFMVIGWSLPAGLNHFIPWIYAFYILGMAIYKAHYFDRILQNSCTENAYEDYHKHVKYILIPFIY